MSHRHEDQGNPAVLEDGLDQRCSLRHQSLAPGEDVCVGSQFIGELEVPIAGHPCPYLEADLRLIAVPAAEFGGR
jgi:hypothetical protein